MSDEVPGADPAPGEPVGSVKAARPSARSPAGDPPPTMAAAGWVPAAVSGTGRNVARSAREAGAGEVPGGTVPAGPDLARSALDAARAAARVRRAKPATKSTRSGKGQGRPRRGLTGSGPDLGDPQPFGALIERLVHDRGWEGSAADAAVMGRWDSLVGADVAAHCHPQSLRNGELVLEAESTAWATQLRLLTSRMLATLARELGPDVVTTIRVHGPTAPSWRKGPRHVAGRGPRDTYG